MSGLLIKHGSNAYCIVGTAGDHRDEFVWRVAPLHHYGNWHSRVSKFASIKCFRTVDSEYKFYSGLVSLDLAGCDLYLARETPYYVELWSFNPGVRSHGVYPLKTMGIVMHELGSI